MIPKGFYVLVRMQAKNGNHILLTSRTTDVICKEERYLSFPSMQIDCTVITIPNNLCLKTWMLSTEIVQTEMCICGGRLPLADWENCQVVFL